MKQVSGSKMTVSELRTRVRALAPRMSGQLEEVADDIASHSNDPVVRLRMTRFKINVLPQVQLAMFRADPVEALIDTWALTVQLERMLDEPSVGIAVGRPEELTFARERFRSMEGEFQRLWSELTAKTDISATTAEVHRWAEQNPIKESLASRKSTEQLLAAVTSESNVGGLQTVGQLTETTADLSARLDLLTAFGPKAARWEGEYFLRSSLMDPSLLASTGVDAAGIGRELEQMTGTVAQLPDLISRERTAFFDGFRGERLETQQFVDAQRQALTGDLRSERRAAMEDMNRMGLTWVDHSFDRANALVDRLLLRLLIVAGLFVLGGLLVALLLIRAWERNRVTPNRQHPLGPRVPA